MSDENITNLLKKETEGGPLAYNTILQTAVLFMFFWYMSTMVQFVSIIIIITI